MEVALEKFVQQLEDSGILSSETLKDFLPPKSTPKDVEELAKELVRKKKLTKFQAGEVYRGKAKSLVLGNYVLLEKIGAGGMGQVYRAEHRRMHRIVALKLLPVAMTKDQAAIARFEREVTAAAKLSHPNIVTAHDADCANGIHFLVMECVEGSDLSVLVKANGPFPLDKAVNYVLQAARGLEAAHAEGVVHRDIKPANLLLDKKGTVKILDMGLARLGTDGEALTQAELTSTGAVMGTIDYMAPEQALNTKTADARADIYSLGCTLFYLLTGKATYDLDSLMAKLLAHREMPIPSLRASGLDVPEEIEDVFRKMVAKKVADRYQSMTAVIADLEKFSVRQHEPISVQQSAATSDTDLTNFIQGISAEPRKPAKSKPKKRLSNPGWEKSKKRLLIAVGLLAALVVIAGTMVSLGTKDGTLVVEVNEPDAQVQVLSEEGKVEITLKGEKGPISLAVDPGKHRLKVTKDGFVFFAKDFEMESGGTQTITAKLIPLADDNRLVPKDKGPLAFETPGFDQWVKTVGPLPVEEQVKSVIKKLQELNPGFDGRETHEIDGGTVVKLAFVTDQIADISPVRALPSVRWLTCLGSEPGKGKLADLSPLKGMTSVTNFACSNTQVTDLTPLWGMPLGFLSCSDTGVSSLSPLQGMPLRNLHVSYTAVTDLSPLKGMPLTVLNCAGTKVSDLSPLKEMALEVLGCSYTSVSDLSALQGMPLTVLACDSTLVDDLSPLQGMPLSSLNIHMTKVSDITPLKGMPLTAELCIHNTAVASLSALKDSPLVRLQCDFRYERAAEILRSIKSLEKVNDKPVEQFWKEAESQQVAFGQWTKDVAALPAEEQVKSVIKKLQELNPGFDGTEMHQIHDGTVTEFRLDTDHIADISPVRALGGLKTLKCNGSPPDKGKLADLSPLKGMRLKSLECEFTQVSDLSPLKEMPLDSLICNYTSISDLSPLEDAPLTTLGVTSTQVSDLSPLKGKPLSLLSFQRIPVSDISAIKDMPLKTLWCDVSPVRDAELLRSIKTLETINNIPAAEFWKDLTAQQAAFEQWTKDVAALPAEEQVKAVVKKLQELNAGFDGQETHRTENGVITELYFVTDELKDISPVRALTGLQHLDLGGTNTESGRLSDLSPLVGLPIRWLSCRNTQVFDLSPIKGLPLTYLDCSGTLVSDLAPLKGLSLTQLLFHITKVSDLSPLQGMPLTSLACERTEVVDLSPLSGMPLSHLQIALTGVSDLTPLKGMPLTGLTAHGSQVSDLTPLRELPLNRLSCDNTRVSDLSPLAGMATLRVLHCSGTLVSDLSPLKGLSLTQLLFQTTKVFDLSPLQGMPLTQLACDLTPVVDLSPLRGMPLTRLQIAATGVSDLTPLIGMPLTSLTAHGSKVSDLSPLRGLPLIDLSCDNTGVSDLSPLAEMATLRVLRCSGAQVADLSHLEGLALEEFYCEGTAIADLSPLSGMNLQVLECQNTRLGDLTGLKTFPLRRVHCDFKYQRDAEILRSIKTLETINGKAAEEHWKEVGNK